MNQKIRKGVLSAIEMNKKVKIKTEEKDEKIQFNFIQ